MPSSTKLVDYWQEADFRDTSLKRQKLGLLHAARHPRLLRPDACWEWTLMGYVAIVSEYGLFPSDLLDGQ